MRRGSTKEFTMHNRRPPLPAIILVLILIAAGIYYGVRSLNAEADGQLAASGTIESVVVNISPEMAGKVTEVLAEEGQLAKAGDPLLHLDDSLLQSEKRTAQAVLDSANAGVQTAQVALESARLQYDVILNNALSQDSTSRLAVWDESKPTEFDQPMWYFSKEERIAAAQAQVDSTQLALDDAMKKLDEVNGRAGSSDFLKVEATLAQGRLAFQNVQDVLDNTSGASDSQDLRDAAQIVLDEVQIDLDDAQKDYDDALTTEGATDVIQARADAIIAQEIHDSAVDKLRALQTGADSLQVQTAEKAVAQAQAMLEQAQANVKSAQARLDTLDVHLGRTAAYAPMNGMILIRNVEVGEFVQPGAVAF